MLKVIAVVVLIFLLGSLNKCISAMTPTPRFISKEVLPYTPEQLVKLTQEKKLQAERDKQELEVARRAAFNSNRAEGDLLRCSDYVGLHIKWWDTGYKEGIDRCMALMNEVHNKRGY